MRTGDRAPPSRAAVLRAWAAAGDIGAAIVLRSILSESERAGKVQCSLRR